MEAKPITITEVARNLAEYVNRVIYLKERFTLVRGNRPVAELGPPLVSRNLKELPDLLRTLPQLTPDDAAAFGADLDAARSEVAGGRLFDPWAS